MPAMAMFSGFGDSDVIGNGARPSGLTLALFEVGSGIVGGERGTLDAHPPIFALWDLMGTAIPALLFGGIRQEMGSKG